MPHFTSDNAYDAALDYVINNCAKAVVCAGAPTSWANIQTANGTGSGQRIAEIAFIGADFSKANGDTSGRKLTAVSKAAVAVTAAGDADHVAYIDATSEILHYFQLATTRVGLTTSDTVNVPTHDLEIRDTVAE